MVRLPPGRLGNWRLVSLSGSLRFLARNGYLGEKSDRKGSTETEKRQGLIGPLATGAAAPPKLQLMHGAAIPSRIELTPTDVCFIERVLLQPAATTLLRILLASGRGHQSYHEPPHTVSSHDSRLRQQPSIALPKPMWCNRGCTQTTRTSCRLTYVPVTDAGFRSRSHRVIPISRNAHAPTIIHAWKSETKFQYCRR